MKWTLWRRGSVGAVLFMLAGCAEEPIDPVAGTSGPAAQDFAVQLTCTVSVGAEDALTCRPAIQVAGNTNRPDFDLIVGSQHQFVRMANDAPTVEGDVFSANITVQNLTLQPMGTMDGSTPITSGVRVFLKQSPTNGVTTANHDGSASFTGSTPQNYFEYSGSALGADGILQSGEVSSAKSWQFALNGATEFQFSILISAAVPNPSAYSVHLTRVVAGYAFTCAETSDGKIYCWGQNNEGQLGDGTSVDRSIPAQVNAPGGLRLTGLVTGDHHACAIGLNEKVYCWGWNYYGQLGVGDGGSRFVPWEVPLPGGVTISRLAAGGHHTCGEGNGRVLYCWGRNENGELGNNVSGTGAMSLSPVVVSDPGGLWLTRVVAGVAHTCAIAYSGDAYCWGSSSRGQLGTNSFVQYNVPTQVYTGFLPEDTKFTALGAGDLQTCGTALTGVVYCWGSNEHGQAGYGGWGESMHFARPAVAAPEGVMLSDFTGGIGHTCAVGSDEQAYCWGFNANGNLGFGHTTRVLTPTAVPLPEGTKVTSVTAGYVHSCATTRNGPVYCWGNSGNGQVGDGTRIERWSPVIVAGTR